MSAGFFSFGLTPTLFVLGDALMRFVLFLCLFCVGIEFSQAQNVEVQAEPPFRMEAFRNLGLSYGGPHNCWAVVNVGGGPRVAYIDFSGQLIEHRLVSWDTTSPAELSVSEGQVFVRYQGWTFRFAQQFRYEQRLVVAPVTRYHQGLVLQWPHTQPELLSVPVLVSGPQWVEVVSPAAPSAIEILPTPVSPSKDTMRLRPPTPVKPDSLFGA